MKTNTNYEYDVALSFAGEQRDYVREVAKVLAEEYELKVFFDEFEEEKLWGKNLYDYLYEIYSKKSKYVIIFVSKEYKEKIWTNHERQAAQEKALHLKNQEYILPVKFDETNIPGLSSTIKYLDANKYSPYQIALLFAKKMNLQVKYRWFGKWERERLSKAVNGDLKIYNVTKDGFYFNILVIHGSHMGELNKQYATFLNQYEAISKIDEYEECKLKFTMLNKNIYVQEENCFAYHGMRAYFDGKYILQKDFFYLFEKLNDRILSKLYDILGEKGYEDFEMCFSDYWINEETNRYILYGKVPGMFPYYNGCLILENDEIRGFFVNCNIKDDTIFWFATDNKKDEELQKFLKENEQFKDYKIKKFEKYKG
jgi:hypothetical protein